MKEFIRSDKGRIAYWILGIIAACDFSIFLIPPLYNLIVNRIDPFVLGMPWIVFMQIVLWVIFAANMNCLYWVQKIRGEL